MPTFLAGPEIRRLIDLLAKLPGFGPRSARRAALHLIKKREALLLPLASAAQDAAQKVLVCSLCGNIDTREPCGICTDVRRDGSILCVVEGISDLWALERAGVHKGRYHVLGGTLSALDGVGPEDLNIDRLLARACAEGVREVVLALNATVDGQTTAYYLTDRLMENSIRVTRLAHGVPVGGELDYLDDGTLAAAMKSRQSL